MDHLWPGAIKDRYICVIMVNNLGGDVDMAILILVSINWLQVLHIRRLRSYTINQIRWILISLPSGDKPPNHEPLPTCAYFVSIKAPLSVSGSQRQKDMS